LAGKTNSGLTLSCEGSRALHRQVVVVGVEE
jgi:hypothetical protein